MIKIYIVPFKIVARWQRAETENGFFYFPYSQSTDQFYISEQTYNNYVFNIKELTICKTLELTEIEHLNFIAIDAPTIN